MQLPNSLAVRLIVTQRLDSSEMPHTVAGLCLLKSVLAIRPERQASEMWGTQEPVSGAVETRPSQYKMR